MKRAAVFVAGALFVPVLVAITFLWADIVIPLLLLAFTVLLCGMIGSVAMWTYDDWRRGR